jgi:ubiquinol-cytochrome c reductase cytochrome b subunit
MSILFRGCIAVCILALVPCCAIIRPKVVYALDGASRDRGSTAFQKSGCQQCHSITGVGGDRAPDLGAVGKRLTAGQIKKQILEGGRGMPPFGEVLPNDVVDDLVAFLRTCKSLTAPGCRTWTTTQHPQ